MATTQPVYDGILRQALNLPYEQKVRLLEEILQHELGSSAENKRPFLEKLDEALTRLAARMRSGVAQAEHSASLQISGSPRRPDHVRQDKVVSD